MKILMINPNSSTYTDKCLKEKIKVLNMSDIVDVAHMKSGPELMLTYKEMAEVLPEMMQIVEKGEYDAYIVGCHSDPNLDVLKEISKKPVLGIGEVSMKMASLFCNGFAIVSPSEKSVARKWLLARKYNCEQLYKGAVFPAENCRQSLLEAARRAQNDFYVDGVILGCANYTNYDKYIQKETGLKVIDGVSYALILAKSLVEYEKYLEVKSID